MTTKRPTKRPATVSQRARKARRARALVVWLGFGLGVLVSVAFNVKSALHTGDMMAWFAAIVWPVFAVIAVETLVRVEWGKGWGWMLARFGGVGLVALGAMKLSLTHVVGVLMSWQYSRFDAITGAMVIDGLMLLSGAGLLAMHTAPKPSRKRRAKATRARVVPARPVAVPVAA